MGINTELLNCSLEEMRSKIDAIDDDILALIQKREDCVIEIARIKQAMSEVPKYYAPEREKKIIDRIKKNYKGHFPVSVIESIFHSIIKNSRLIQSNRNAR